MFPFTLIFSRLFPGTLELNTIMIAFYVCAKIGLKNMSQYFTTLAFDIVMLFASGLMLI